MYSAGSGLFEKTNPPGSKPFSNFNFIIFSTGEEKAKPLNFNELPKHSSAGLDALDRLKRRLYLQESEKVEVQVKFTMF